jgi:hypothetical protein
MRKPDVTLAAAPTAERRDRASRQVVCLALVLALTALLCRIATFW